MLSSWKASLSTWCMLQLRRYMRCRLMRPTEEKARLTRTPRAFPRRSSTWISGLRFSGMVVNPALKHSATFFPSAHLQMHPSVQVAVQSAFARPVLAQRSKRKSRIPIIRDTRPHSSVPITKTRLNQIRFKLKQFKHHFSLLAFDDSLQTLGQATSPKRE